MERAGFEELLGDAALRRSPPARRRGGRPGMDAPCVAVRRAGLAPQEQAELERAGARVALLPGPRDADLELAVACAVEALPLLSGGSAGARAIAAAWTAACAPPRPPRCLGIVNVTPDSFSDGGLYLDPGRAVEHGLALEEAGADALDVGGESTRPGASAVDPEVELERVLPVVRGLARAAGVPISIDTTKARVAERALDAGASIVNDVGAGRLDPDMLPLVRRSGCTYVLMHMLGTPRTMQQAPRYRDVMQTLVAFLRERAAACLRAGIDPTRLVVDPGIGFGKTLEHNLTILRELRQLRSLGLPVLVGVSRKSFLGALEQRLGAPEPVAPGALAPERRGGTAAAVTLSVLGGADWLRVHDVATMAAAMRAAWVLRAPGGEA
jgi:dihydropteroate synthase